MSANISHNPPKERTRRIQKRGLKQNSASKSSSVTLYFLVLLYLL